MVVDRHLSSEPVHRINLQSRVFAVEFSPYEWSARLMAIGLAKSVMIKEMRFSEDDKKIEFETIADIHHDSRVQALSWSPKTSLIVAPHALFFATSGTDHKLRIFSLISNKTQTTVMKGHTDFINSISFEPESGDQVITCSDDHSAKMWDVAKAQVIHTFHLTSPGMMGSWHHHDNGKIVIAQKSGLVSVYNSTNLTPILSLDSCGSPLLSADWALTNSLVITAAVGSDLVFFDLSRPSLPTHRRTMHAEGSKIVKFSRTSESLTASVGKPSAGLKIGHNFGGQTLVSVQKKVVGGGLSWHLNLPYLAVGNDREVDLYHISP